MKEHLGGRPQDSLARCPTTLAGGDAALRRLWELPERPAAVATSTDLVVRTAVCVVDRDEGGAEALAAQGVRLCPIFRASEVLEATKTPAKPHG